MPLSNQSMVSTIKSEIEDIINKNCLNLRLGKLNDIERISNFQKELFNPHNVTLETDYELFRIIKFGYALLIENIDGEILGCYTTIHYGTKEKVGYGIKLGVSPKISGHNYAAHLAKYATILAYENGCTYFRALMSPTNIRSAANVLNHVGYYCEEFHRNIPSFGTRFEITLPLNQNTFFNTEINFDKVKEFINDSTIDKDFVLFSPHEIDKIETAYLQTKFKIIAYLKKGLIDNNDYFFAIELTSP